MTPGLGMEMKGSQAVTQYHDEDVGAQEGEFKPDFVPLTAEQAQELRKTNPPVSYLRVIVGQMLTGLVVALVAWGATGQRSVGWSAAYGALAVVIPAALFARGLSSPLLARNPGSAVMGFFLWEAVKIALTVAMLFAAPKWVANLSWPALLVGLVVTMKMYWLVPAFGKFFQVQSKSESKTELSE